MKFNRLIFVTLSLFVFFNVQGQEKEQALKPEIILQPKYVALEYYGKQFVGAEVKVMNLGSAPLIIRHIKPSCQCLSGVVERSTVPPMGIGKIRLNVNTVNIKDSLSRVDLYLYTNQSDDPISLPIYLTKKEHPYSDSAQVKSK